jgi:hypothetical protein
MNQWMTLKIMENLMRVVPSNNNYLRPRLHDILLQLGTLNYGEVDVNQDDPDYVMNGTINIVA